MPDIDNRIVSMQFDNQQFEKNVKTTLTSLDKLKQALSFDNIKNSLSNFSFSGLIDKIKGVKQAADSDVFGGMQKSLDMIVAGATNMGSRIDRIINDINGKIDESIKKFYDFTVTKPVTDGFNEYELKMGSVQTIQASTGEDLETINEYLAELNTYADRTIYSFKDMTASIGKFTNSGVELGDAVAAIQGVSNVAAISGANAEQASHAMYNFAQALSSGAVKLTDWKSIEVANMATVEFKQNLIDTAIELGTLIDQGDGTMRSTTTDNNGNFWNDTLSATQRFNESLSTQWMTTEVLVQTLAKYTDETTELGQKAFAAAQDVKTWTQLVDTLGEALGSGWATSFEILIGDFDQAKELFTVINNVLSPIIDKVGDFRNNILRTFVSMGGREKIIDAITVALGKLETAVDNALIFADKGLKLMLGEDYATTFDSIAEGLSDIGNVASEVITKTDVDRWQAAVDIWTKGTYGNGQERRDAINAIFQDEDESYYAIQEILEKIIAGEVDYNEELKKVKEQYENNQKALSKNNDEMSTMLTLEDKLTIVGESIRDTFIGIYNVFANVTAAIKNVTDIFFETMGKTFDFQDVFSDITGVVWDFEYFSEVLRGISENGSSLRDIFTRFFEGLNYIYYKISEFISAVRMNVTMIFDELTSNPEVFTKIMTFAHYIYEAVQTLFAGLSNIFQIIVNIGGALIDSFLTNFDFDLIAETILAVVDALTAWTQPVKEMTENTGGMISIFDKIFTVLNAVFRVVSKIIIFIVKTGGTVVETIARIIQGISELTNNGEGSVFERGWEAIKLIIEKFGEAFSSIKGFLTEDTGNGSILDGLIEFITVLLSGGLEVLVTFLEKIASFDFDFSDAKNPFGIFTDWLKSVLTVDNMKMVLDWAVKVGNSILSSIADLDWSTIWSITSFVLFVTMGMKILSVLKSCTTLLQSITNITNTISTSVKEIGNAIKMKILGDVFNTTLLLMLGMFAMLIVFTEIPEDKLTMAALIMITILSILKDVTTKILDTVNTTHTSNSRLAKLTGFMSSFAAMFAGLAGLIISMSIMAYIFDQTEHPVKMMIMSIILLAAVGGVMVGLMFALKKLGTNNLEKQFKGLRDGFLGMSACIAAVTAIAWVIDKTNIGWMAILKAIVLMVAIAGVMVGLMAVVKKFNTGANKLKKFAVSMTILAGAIDALIPMYIVMALLDGILHADILTITGAIVALLLSMSALIFSMSKATSGMGSGTIKKLLMLSVAIGIVIGVLTYLINSGGLMSIMTAFTTDDGPEKFIFVLEGIALGLAAIALVITLLAYAVSKAPTMGAALMTVGTSILFIGVGVVAAAAGILLLVYAFTLLPEAAEGFIKAAQILQEQGPTVVKTVATLVILIISAILAAVAVMKGSAAIQVVALIAYILVVAGVFLHGHVQEAADFIGAVLMDVVLFVAKVADYIAKAALGVIILITGNLAILLVRNEELILDILGTAISGIIRHLFAYISEEVGKGLGDLMRSIIPEDAIDDFFIPMLKSDDPVSKAIAEWAYPLAKGAYMVKGAAGHEFAERLREDGEANAAEIEEVLKQTSGELQSVSDKATDIIDGFKDKLNGVEGSLTGSMSWASGYNTSEITNAITKFMGDPMSKVKSGGIAFHAAGNAAGKEILKGYEQVANALEIAEVQERQRKATLQAYMDETGFSGSWGIKSFEDWSKEQEETMGEAFTSLSAMAQSVQYENYKKEAGFSIGGLFNSGTNNALFEQLDFGAMNTSGDYTDLLNQYMSGESVDWSQVDMENFNEYLDENGYDGEMFDYGELMGEDAGDGALEGLEDKITEFEEAGNIVGEALMNSFDGVTIERAKQAGTKLASETYNAFTTKNLNLEKDYSEQGRKNGEATTSGFLEGIKSKMKAISDSAEDSGNIFTKAFAKVMGIFSPSRVMRRMGEYTIEGLIEGVENKQNNVRTISEETAGSMTDILKTPIDSFISYLNNNSAYNPVITPTVVNSGPVNSMLSYLMSYANGELEYDPSIRPTMDISAVQHDIGLAANIVGNETMRFGSDVSLDLDKATLDKIDYSNNLMDGYSNNNIVDALTLLNGDVNKLNENMASMQIVMDTGALVGQMAQPMDNALGRRQYLRGRGF